MATHIVTGSGAPTIAPTALAQHYVDLTNGTVYQAAGTNSAADWKPSTTVTNEQLQDVIGPMFDNTASAPISSTYDDVNNRVVISINQSQINHNSLQNVGTNSHVQIDNHISNNANPHSVTKSQVGLSNVDNTSDLNKPVSNATQTALNSKINLSEKGLANGVATLDASAKIPTVQIPALNYAPVGHTHTSSEITDFSSAVQTIGDLNYSGINHTHNNATSVVAGFMSPADKSKLDGLTNSVIPISVSTLANSSNTTFTNITELLINCVSGKIYKFCFYIRHSSNATGTGITFSINGTATGSIGAKAFISTSRTATSIPSLNSLGGLLAVTGVPSTNVELTTIEGLFVCSGDGVIYPQFRSELSGNQVLVLGSSIVEYNEL